MSEAAWEADVPEGDEGDPVVKVEHDESWEEEETQEDPDLGDNLDNNFSTDDEDYKPKKKKRKTQKPDLKKPTPTAEPRPALTKLMTPTSEQKPAAYFPKPPITITAVKVIKRNSISLKGKLKIIERIEKGEPQKEVAKSFKLARTTVCKIWKMRDHFREESLHQNLSKTKLRKPRNGQVESLVLNWLEHQRGQGDPPNGNQIRAYAKFAAESIGQGDFNASSGWMEAFKKRHNLILPKTRQPDKRLEEIMRREQEREIAEKTEDDAAEWDAGADVDDILDSLGSPCPAGPTSLPPPSRSSVSSELQKSSPPSHGMTDKFLPFFAGYSQKDIFFLHEFAMFYRFPPEDFESVKSLSCEDGVLAVERFSVLFGVNGTGSEKLKLVVVGGNPQPSSFGEWSESEGNQDKLPTEYYFHPKAFITPNRIASWLTRWNSKLEAEGNGRKVLVVLSQSKVHQIVEILCSGLNSVKICVPIQDLGRLETDICGEVKWQYSKLLLNWFISNCSEKLSVLEAIGLLQAAWNGIQPDFIKETFNKSGLVEGGASGGSNKRQDSSYIQALVKESKRVGIRCPKHLSFQSLAKLGENLIAVDMTDGLMDRSYIENQSNESSKCTGTPSHPSLINTLSQLQNWAVFNSSTDLTQLHNAISTINSFCLANLTPGPEAPLEQAPSHNYQQQVTYQPW